ncbi:UbiD-like decarboxylase [Paraburkholderia aspalathi]|uniref:UbiD family decarboxylase n=1 Tax=Paraburkholderia aspalathi TaxID=1324617 RepID=UPI001B0D2322|nr:UbiD family decarboxylase [Paraburkholderia aspalathi]CAE6816760.1 UbiD-like decarboxylase [Paraburkholderia aspalathi]
MARFKDLRDYLGLLKTLGDVESIDFSVSPILEAAAFTRRSTEQRRPAPLFENVEGASPGFRLLGAAGALSSIPDHPLARVALSLGLPHDISARDLVEHMVKANQAPPIPPKVVDSATAPCKQNILLGPDATLDRFPVPMVHPADGARYVNTWGVIVAKTPDGRWTNWSISRVMMLDGRHMTGLVLPQQHIGMVWKEWAELGQPMPYAIVLGGDPGVTMIGGMPVPDNVDEVALLGAIYGEPVEVVKCETVDLHVPAGAEIVIEGYVSPKRDATEGPYAEFHGWALDETSPEPIFSIEAITYRDNPIWPLSATGRPADDSQVGPAIGVSAELTALLQSAGLPVNVAWLLVDTACTWMIVTVRRDWRNALPGIETSELVHRIGTTMSTNRVGRMCPVTYVFDDDIDPSNTSDVLWALGTRVHPNLRKEQWQVEILPWYLCYTEEERHSGHGSIVVHDGLLPPMTSASPRHATFDTLYPAEIRERVLAAE